MKRKFLISAFLLIGISLALIYFPNKINFFLAKKTVQTAKTAPEKIIAVKPGQTVDTGVYLKSGTRVQIRQLQEESGSYLLVNKEIGSIRIKKRTQNLIGVDPPGPIIVRNIGHTTLVLSIK
jgi:hypothetical protein